MEKGPERLLVDRARKGKVAKFCHVEVSAISQPRGPIATTIILASIQNKSHV
jgi:hypothetical protein